MKKLTKLIYMIAALFLFTACENFLDITPQGQVKRDDLLSTNQGVEDAMYGVYAQMRSRSLYGAELSYSALDVMAQYFESYGNKKVEALLKYDYNYSSVESLFEGTWISMYKNISNVNSVLSCDLVKNATAYPAKIYRGEALGMRAFMHFDLLRIFTEQITLNPEATGIPYATEFSLNTPAFYTAAKVYDNILVDLLKAEELLADEGQYEGERAFMTMRQIHFNVHAVRATLARVYLTMGDYDNALKYANKVIAEGGRTLLKYNEIKGDVEGILSRKECIFGIQSSTDFYSNVYSDLWLSTSFYSLNPRPDYDAVYTAGGEEDYRVAAYYETQAVGSVRFVKLIDRYKVNGDEYNRPADVIQGINMIRLPEMYYIASECLMNKNLLKEAVEMLNKARASRGVTEMDVNTTTASMLADAINNERYKELVGEGQTFFNMKRHNMPITTIEGATLSASNNIYVIPIPDVEYEYRN